MSMNNLTVDGEFRYIIQWFNEFSELQRDDFIPIMVDYITDTSHAATIDPTAAATITMNGLPNSMERSLNLNEKPMSLFQCRVKLFSQWNRRWPADFKDKLQQKIKEIDNKIGERIQEAVNAKYNGCGSLTNGYAGTNDDDLHHYECNEFMTQDQQQKQQPQSQLNSIGSQAKDDQPTQHDIVVVTNTVTLNDPMREVLSNETSVDDIELNEQQQVNINRVEVNNDNVAHGINEDGNSSPLALREPVDQVGQMRNLQINEDGHEDVTASPSVSSAVQQQPTHTTAQTTTVSPVTVTVSPVVVVAAAQSMATNAEVPLVV
ncbi:uncharacterized protein LOC106087046 [Stomoxys calcitrans]|uniref:Uncharacterized protein n=1 Tax=Stomoxys calcitrans TaxID=35570 RepID=A0A1I8PYK1_STOCA|nr:uncharacterized protein LOC106087046 [Stomoxys calcitrans]XP_013107378.1 uncharacterized protein LOC106087046 [Stomoxys calcitrans]XP_013107379.1 uncharacterized protein LOC106087046 [Stomoxys calcitrans]XP_013107380.1 uncharacterized protein LOC106087046 [Stomoxys calcitrans]XP_013107382.1 uncharacterized protein LOC106087046 [Stomoxys calcitrans]XP_059218231.1 uncharacterized protein LOC106087046 [Stomoxys calcitrans]